VCWTADFGALVALVVLAAFVALATLTALHVLWSGHMTFSKEQQQHARKLFIEECRFARE
jgi:hypothetical protein